MRNLFSWGNVGSKENFELKSRNDDFLGESKDCDEDRMRRNLNDIKEAIKENRPHSSIFKKIEKCEKEVFQLYSTSRIDNRSESSGINTGIENKHNDEKVKTLIGHVDQSSSDDEHIEEFNIDK